MNLAALGERSKRRPSSLVKLATSWWQATNALSGPLYTTWRGAREVGESHRRTSELTLEHADLMTEQQDLDLLLPLCPAPEHGQLQHPRQDQ